MIKILTDSTAYMTKEFVEKNDITMIPLKLLFNGKESLEGYPSSYEEMYEEIDRTKNFPKTSQPSLETFINVFDKVIDDDNEAILFTISESLSGTFSGANIAKQSCKDPSKITVINSEACGHTVWGYIDEAIKLIKENKSVSEIVEQITMLKINSGIQFVPESLEYLKRGGRIGSVSAILGTMLGLKPLLCFRKGVLKNIKTVMGINGAMKELLTSLPKNIEKLYIIKVGKSEFFQKFLAKAKIAFPSLNILTGEIGPVVGAHVGPSIGCAWIARPLS